MFDAAHPRRALFLDRDGVVNREQGYVWQLKDFELLDGFFEFSKAYTARGYDLVVITNQGGIGKGLYTPADVAVLHAHLQAELQARGLPEARVFVCPHHPSTSRCCCRKPSDLLFRRAIALGGYDPAQCWMVGDRVRDVEAAKALGMRTLLIATHADEEGPTPAADIVVADHAQATAKLLAALA